MVDAEHKTQPDGTAPVIAWVERVGRVAQGIRTLSLSLWLMSVFAFGSIFWFWHHAALAHWINGILLVVCLVPVSLCFLFWRLVSRLVDAPDEMREVLQDPEHGYASAVTQLQQLNVREPKGFVSLLMSANQVRKTDGFEPLIEMLGSVALLSNPLFAVSLVLAMLSTIGASFLALFIWVFF